MATPADIIGRGATGSKPAAGIEGRLYYDTTLEKLQRDSGADWENCEPVVTGAADSGWIDANETWTYASADDPTFTFTIASMDATAKYSPGMRIKLTQSAAVKYFIITKVVFDDPGSTITVYGGTDYDLADAAISDNYYSAVKAPLNFPLDPTKWTVEVTDTSNQSQATPTQNTWYNVGSITISIPIGIWSVEYSAFCKNNDNSTAADFRVTLSTANNSESDVDLTAGGYGQYTGATDATIINSVKTRKTLVIAAKTSYYLNVRTTIANTVTLGIRGDLVKTIIQAVCSYL